MNIAFNEELGGKTHKSTRDKIKILLGNLFAETGVDPRHWTAKISRTNHKTDLTDDGCQLKSYGGKEAVITIRIKGSLYGAAIAFTNGGLDLLVSRMKKLSNRDAQMTMIEGAFIFEKKKEEPIRNPLPTRPPQPAPKPAPVPDPQPAAQPSEDGQQQFTLCREGVSIAFLAISEALGDGDTFEKGEAFEWIVDAKIGVTLNRHAGRVISGMVRCCVIENVSGDTFKFTDLGKRVAAGAEEFPEVPREQRQRRKEKTAGEELEGFLGTKGDAEEDDSSTNIDKAEDESLAELDLDNLPPSIFDSLDEKGAQRVCRIIRIMTEMEALQGEYLGIVARIRQDLGDKRADEILKATLVLGYTEH